MFVIGVLVMINTKAALVSATAWVSGIAGILGGMTGAHTLCYCKKFAATMVFSLLSMTKFWVRYKEGGILNVFKHLPNIFSTPHCQLDGN
jgi:hypothetical protein